MSQLTRAPEQAADIEAVLAAALQDPGLTVGYLLDGGLEVRPDGSAVPPSDTGATTELVGMNGIVARVHHTTEGTDAARLADAVRGPGRLALENGWLLCQERRKAAELAASRRRLVEHTDAERRRLERDLHDSAQQHVLALGTAVDAALQDVVDDGDRAALMRCLAGDTSGAGRAA